MIPLTAITAGIFFAIGAFINSVPSIVDAFAPVVSITSCNRHHNILPSSTPITVSYPIYMSGEESSNESSDSTGTSTVEDSATSTPTTDDVDDAGTTTDTTNGKKSSSSSKEAKKEDKLVKELKESIASLESSLKAKKSQLSHLKDTADKYSSAGYARQVALVENNKRMRGANVADNTSASRASVLQAFLPVLDELETLGQQYESNGFARTLNSGLRSELDKALNELGVTEYRVESGQAIMGGSNVAAGRVVAVEEEYSEEYGRGTVIRQLKSGLEIKGNVIRPAEVVGSLGQESSSAEQSAAVVGEESGDANDSDAGEVLSE